MIIGCNCSNETYFGGIISSFSGIFTNENIQIEGGLGDIVKCNIGDVSDAYIMLKQEILKNNPTTKEDMILCIFKVVVSYFGDYSNISERMSFYPNEDEIYYDKLNRGTISNLKGKNAAMCVERAMLSQNLLKVSGINSFYKCSGILNNGKSDTHAYNIIELQDKFYIFDATIPTLKENKITPLICEIPKYVFDKITSGDSNIGYAVSIEHYNPLRKMNKNIVYDSGHREMLYDANLKENKINM